MTATYYRVLMLFLLGSFLGWVYPGSREREVGMISTARQTTDCHDGHGQWWRGVGRHVQYLRRQYGPFGFGKGSRSMVVWWFEGVLVLISPAR